MKRAFVILFVLLILLGNFVLAQDSLAEGFDNVKGDKNEDLKEGAVADIQEGVDASGFKDKSNELLVKEIDIPDNLQFVSKVLFGLGAEQEINLSEFIIFVILWFMIFLVLAKAFQVISWSDKKFVAWFQAVITTCLLGIVGAIREASLFLFDFFSFINLLEKYPLIKLILFVIIALLILYISLKIFKTLGENAKEAENRVAGIRTGVASEVLARRAEAQTGQRIPIF